MPGFDRSGPTGTGPLTGRQQGYCNPATRGSAAYMARGYGFGRGMGLRRGFRGGFGPGRGMERGSGRGFYQAVAVDSPRPSGNELQMLKSDADAMQKSLEAIRDRIKTLEKEV